MAVEYVTTSRAPREPQSSNDERVRLRAAVLRLGGFLGWQPREVIAFAEAVTNQPWRRCGPADFEAVLEEYSSLLRAIHDKAERRAAGRERARLERTEVQDHADRP